MKSLGVTGNIVLTTIVVLFLLIIALYSIRGYYTASSQQQIDSQPANIDMSFDGEIPDSSLDEEHPLTAEQQAEVDAMYPIDPGPPTEE